MGEWLVAAGVAVVLAVALAGAVWFLVARCLQCRCLVRESRASLSSADPPFTLPYERPDGPAGSGIYAINW